MGKLIALIISIIVPFVCLASGTTLGGFNIKELQRQDNMVIFTVKIDVTNQGESKEMSLILRGIDKDGFERESVAVTGVVANGSKETLTTKSIARADDYDSIVTWKAREQ